mmetsp:Transcript_5563/g.34467  ORF Transcript_5563/g.34467 Transcript_5563/m.34467 type:complete len:237 (-) Transcript_5563:148-858(-)
MSEHQHAQSRLGAQGKRQVWLFWGRFSSVLQLRQHLAQVQGRAREEESITEHRLLGILDCVTVGFPCSVGSYFFYRCIGSTGSCPWGVNQLGRLSLQPRLRPRRTLVVPCVSLDTAAMVGVFVVFTAFHRPVGFVLLQAFSLLLPFGLAPLDIRFLFVWKQDVWVRSTSSSTRPRSSRRLSTCVPTRRCAMRIPWPFHPFRLALGCFVASSRTALRQLPWPQVRDATATCDRPFRP